MPEEQNDNSSDQQTPAAPQEKPAKPTGKQKPAEKPKAQKPRLTKMRLLQILLAANLVLVLLVVGVILNLIPRPVTPSSASASPVQPAPAELSDSVTTSSGEKREPVKEDSTPSEPTSVPAEARTSWQSAENAYKGEDYKQAAALYHELATRCDKNPSNKILGEYYSLRECQSLIRTGLGDEARKELPHLAKSYSPIIRAVACFELAMLDLGEGKYLSARSGAYRAMAALGTLERPTGLAADCEFLIARALTEKVRAYKTSKRFIRWPDCSSADPFAGLKDKQLRPMLSDGVRLLKPTSLEPGLAIRKKTGVSGQWRVSSRKVTIEDILNQFGDKAGLDVQWVSVEGPVLRRAGDFYLRSVSPQKFCEIAAGSAGLIGRFTLEKILIYDPASSGSASAQKELLTKEANSAWRKFFYRYRRDVRGPAGRFALAAICELSGEKVAAIREYGLLAKRFNRSSWAPEALLRCARLKVDIMNYNGARVDLLDLLDLYPDHPGVDEVTLLLGRVYKASGELDEAIRVYENLYHRNLSTRSRKAASLEAGRCHYQKQQYEQASKWLARHAAIVKNPENEGYVEAYFLLGRAEAAMGHHAPAVQAFHRGFLGRPAAEVRIPAMVDLIKVHIDSENFVLAVGILNQLAREKLSAAQACEHSVLKARIFRMIGLVDKGRSVLKMQLNRTDDPQLRASVAVELAWCHSAGGDYASARKLLTEIMPDIRSTRLLWEASLLLAEVCGKLNQPDQAIRVAGGLLKSQCPREIRKPAERIIGEAYLSKKQYQKAALYFSGRAESSVPSEKPDASDKKADRTISKSTPGGEK